MDEEEEVKKRRPIYESIIFWLILIIVVEVIALGVRINLSETARQEDPKTKTKEQTKEYYALGEEATLGDIVLKVNKVERTKGENLDKPKEGNEFVVVYITMINTGKKRLNYNVYDFKVKNSEGEIVGPIFSIVNNSTALGGGDIQPGEVVTGSILFEEPIREPDLTLQYQNGMWSYWTLNMKLQ